jgi:hypothetical protein
MTLAFLRAFGQPVHRKIVELGASFELPARDLADIFAAEGYTQTGQHSTTQRAAELGLLPWYMRLMLRSSRKFVDGYAVRVFEPS